ncbi:uncharacterized protein LOC141902617 [Tubulanus polymorphus]|uniref:uncharacterized protein LOC141902617 n=1 Tax=Tubulanus polymorphus TaxID=672921 RepID=UPI003DA25058
MVSVLRVGIVGAGGINFGYPYKLWGHVNKLEKLGGISIIGIVDIDIEKAEKVLESRRTSPKFGHIYKDCQVFADFKQLIALSPDIAIIGIPSGVRGSLEDGKDVELQFVKAGIHLLVEKPLSISPREQFERYRETLVSEAEKRHVIISVGFMFRYHSAVEKMKELIKEHGGKVMAVSVKFYCAYTEMAGRFWFNHNRVFGSTIAEHVSHFCDLTRYITDCEIDLSSVQCMMLKDTDAAGKLAHLPEGLEDENTQECEERRVARVTVAQWRFIEAGIGTFIHTVCLPGTRYECGIDVQLDGLSLSLIDPFGEQACKLRVRTLADATPDIDKYYTYDTYGEDDMYKTELETFLKAVRTNDPTSIRSSYSDAANTQDFIYQLEENAKRN